jgi:hypothetical protein
MTESNLRLLLAVARHDKFTNFKCKMRKKSFQFGKIVDGEGI